MILLILAITLITNIKQLNWIVSIDLSLFRCLFTSELKGLLLAFFFICPSATTSKGCSTRVTSFNDSTISRPFSVNAMRALTPFWSCWYVFPQRSPMRMSALLWSYLYLHWVWHWGPSAMSPRKSS